MANQLKETKKKTKFWNSSAYLENEKQEFQQILDETSGQLKTLLGYTEEWAAEDLSAELELERERQNALQKLSEAGL